ncbi:MAG: glycosyltransferase family 39 protein [Verrucomicrobiota bacterium]|nr:glycosyltransferase family 39 protein [Verrucomicrobiota bacterium]
MTGSTVGTTPTLIARRFLPIVATGLLIVCGVSWLFFLIQKGSLISKDEFITAERSREMLLLGRGAVRDNFEVSVVKPPLQYWLTTLTLPRFEKPETAIRIWPLLFGTLTAIATGWLAYLIEPKHPWLVPMSVALLLTCPLFLMETTSGRLDTGLTLFTTLAIIFAQLARREPKWWLGVAIVCWLGTLLKIPLVVLIWFIIIIVRYFSPGQRATLRTPWLPVSVLLALALMAIWPLVQMTEHGVSLIEVFRFDEALVLVSSSRLGAKPFLEVPFRLTTTWPCGLVALFAAVAVHFGRNKDSRPAVVEISIVSLAMLFLIVLLGFRNGRYLMPLLPYLCVLLAPFLFWLWEQRRPVTSFVLLFVAVSSLLGPEIGRRIVEGRRQDYSQQKLIAKKLGTLQQGEGTQVVILEPNKGVLPEQFYLFYGNLRGPVETWSVAKMREAHPARFAIGVCNIRDFDAVRENYHDVTIEMAQGQFICWRANPF